MNEKKNYERLTITLPEELLKEFREHCKENAINMSGKIAKLIEDYLDSTTD
ncbi:MAG: ribbon-helix-helix domain-containing protein [Candidatus Woesearchaeota archaeon]